jgi:hypothetical protein
MEGPVTEQSNSAAERSAHVTRGDAPLPTDWPVVRMPDGTWRLKSIVALEARIAELEAALKQIEDTDPDESTPWFHEVARAALEGKKDE